MMNSRSVHVCSIPRHPIRRSPRAPKTTMNDETRIADDGAPQCNRRPTSSQNVRRCRSSSANISTRDVMFPRNATVGSFENEVESRGRVLDSTITRR